MLCYRMYAVLSLSISLARSSRCPVSFLSCVAISCCGYAEGDSVPHKNFPVSRRIPVEFPFLFPFKFKFQWLNLNVKLNFKLNCKLSSSTSSSTSSLT